jgi:hypothetical protein
MIDTLQNLNNRTSQKTLCSLIPRIALGAFGFAAKRQEKQDPGQEAGTLAHKEKQERHVQLDLA